jgi:hypothetical protein
MPLVPRIRAIVGVHEPEYTGFIKWSAHRFTFGNLRLRQIKIICKW